ncbi:ubiquitin-like protein Pup [Corynebacterium zhongnanshanii]|uniref:Prokaryotic ubiquitin-like protein Pup n=1 Tax=Corynebacterium zhongnanshanii TaxID=2768834 RepID=A0ABQ6VK55_9CORY|nr:ubiquitin-like protein Pup [Corynebacterium zhongnanshanii]KAB3523521.1 ubiquitin-like protein Pup [Corynebacterium zhongnanshanii]
MTTGGSGQVNAGGGRGDNDSIFDPNSVTGVQENLKVSGTDDLLDEIDGLLESNAEEFVRSYVQKGGQ